MLAFLILGTLTLNYVCMRCSHSGWRRPLFAHEYSDLNPLRDLWSSYVYILSLTSLLGESIVPPEIITFDQKAWPLWISNSHNLFSWTPQFMVVHQTWVIDEMPLYPPSITQLPLSITMALFGRVLASSHLTTLSDYDVLCRFAFRVRYCPRVLDLGDNVHAIDDVAEDDMLTVQMGCAGL